MSQSMAVFILMSNYFHDVATAMPVACSFALWVLLAKYQTQDDEKKHRFFVQLYRAVRKVVLFSWVWIGAAGAIRLITFRSFEWLNAVEKHQETALIIKYAIALGMIIIGACLWIVLSRRAEAILMPKK